MDLHDGASHGCWEICDAAAKLRYNGCLFTKPNHTLLLTQPCTFSRVHPRGAIHCVNDAEYPTLPSTRPFIQLPSLCYTHTPTVQQVRGSHTARTTGWVKCTRSAFAPVSVEMPLSKTRMPNCSSRSSLNWNCAQCIKPSHQACFWLEGRVERGSGLWLQREDQR